MEVGLDLLGVLQRFLLILDQAIAARHSGDTSSLQGISSML